MKKLYTLVAAVLLTAISFAQSPEKMSYQAVVRDSGDALVANQAVGMQISILQGSAVGTAVYTETQSPTTNINGLVSFEIGNGMIISGTFAAIDWSAGPYFIKTETDPTGGNSYSITGTSQLLSVPFALYSANTAGLDLKADKASPTFTGDVIFDTNGVSFNAGNVNFTNGQTFFDSAQVFNSAENIFYGPSVEFNTATNFATGTLNILNSPQTAGSVLTDINGDGNATWQAPVTSTIADGSITEAKLAFDTATQDEIDLKADINSPKFTGSVGIGTTTPDYIMDIEGTGGPRARIYSNDNFYAGLLTQNATHQYFVGTQGTFEAAGGTNSGFHIYDNTVGAQRLVIDANGNIGINNFAPTAKLDIVGTVKIVDGTEGAGKVLTSDVDGLASWQATNKLLNTHEATSGAVNPLSANVTGSLIYTQNAEYPNFPEDLPDGFTCTIINYSNYLFTSNILTTAVFVTDVTGNAGGSSITIPSGGTVNVYVMTNPNTLQKLYYIK